MVVVVDVDVDVVVAAAAAAVVVVVVVEVVLVTPNIRSEIIVKVLSTVLLHEKFHPYRYR